jgi:hypothetical protein
MCCSQSEVEGGDEEKAEDYEAKHSMGDRADSPEEAAQKEAEEVCMTPRRHVCRH